VDNIEHDVWSSPAWRSEVQTWAAAVLADRGERITGPVEQPRIRPWSTQLVVPTSAGRLWFKENAPGLAFEAALVARLAELTPEQVVVPYAVEPRRGWLLSRDAGPTLASLEQTDEATWVRVLQEYAALQRKLAGHAGQVTATGVPVLAPLDAGRWVQAYADELAALPADDPCRVGPDDLRAVRDRVEMLDRAAVALAAGPVPLSLEHNDLHTNNVFVPAAGSRLRFFDFGDTLWAHPFTSVWLALRVLADAWRVGSDDPRLDRLVDAYLEVWCDLAPLDDLRHLRTSAAAFGPVHRVHAWARSLSTTEPRYWAPDLITAGHDWLLEFARPGN
jgi:hypothetical protein